MNNIVGRFHHIGYLVKNIEKSKRIFAGMGALVLTEVKYDEIRKAFICFLDASGVIVELIEPEKNSEIYPLLKKYTNTPYHVCYMVDDLEASVFQLKEMGFLLFKEVQEAPVISNSAKVVFLMHCSIGMVELVQEVQE